jgi:hypothetical protein
MILRNLTLAVAAAALAGLAAAPRTAEATTRRGLSVTAPAPLPSADDALPIPEPPIPPSQPPAFTAAPVPGGSSDGYAAPSVTRAGARVSPDVFSPQSYGEGNGYLAGSTVQSDQDRHRPPAGFRLNVPLQ